MIDLKTKDIYPTIKPVIVKIRAKNKLTPEFANKIAYELMRDIKFVRDIHDNKAIPPFSIKNLKNNIFELYIMIPVSETSLYLNAERLNVIIDKIEYPNVEIYNVSEISNIDLYFISPTSFKTTNSYIPYFEPLMFWKSCIRLWSEFTNYNIVPDIGEDIASKIYPYNMNIKTEKMFLNDKFYIEGFTGTVNLYFAKNISAESKVLILTLLESASCTGVGVKRAWGMGNVEYKIQERKFYNGY
jgi:CRISPR-associated endoribonuclease Cas6